MSDTELNPCVFFECEYPLDCNRYAFDDRHCRYLVIGGLELCEGCEMHTCHCCSSYQPESGTCEFFKIGGDSDELQ